MGGAAKTVGRIGSGVFTLGGSEIARNNLPRNNVIRNVLGLPGTILTGGMAGQDQMPALFGGGDPNPYIGGPFSLDPAQLAADKAAISGLGASQDAQNQQFITSDAESRSGARDQLARLLTQQAQQSFSQTLPKTAEDYNAGHLLNSSGYGNEVARQQSNLAAQIANQVALQGVSDINRTSDQKAAALQGLQGFGNAGLSRQFSLEDFINSANVSKTIGAQTAPQVSSGKGQTGTLLGGVGALAPLVGAARGFGKGGPAGAAAGAASSFV